MAWRHSGARHFRCARPLTPPPHPPPPPTKFAINFGYLTIWSLALQVVIISHWMAVSIVSPLSIPRRPSRSFFSLTTAALSRKSIWGLVATIEDGNHGRSWLATVAESKGWQHDDNAAKYLASLHFAVMTLTVRNRNKSASGHASSAALTLSSSAL